ncbi:MAG TPA: GNAT family protein [Solirubrobacteraceae bacterium]|nr:GNAT family protein [Solirubrobacteraceae bacterium]
MSDGPVQLALEEPVRTERLLLRTLQPGDADAIHAYRSLPEIARYVPFEPMSPELIAERLQGFWARNRAGGEGEGIVVGFERLDTGELVGDLALMLVSDEHRGGEIGWVLNPEHGGRGYATEAARAGLGLMFAAGLHRVVARVDARNEPSLRLCHRLGMRREATLVANEWFKGEWTDEVDYALLEGEWAGR